MRGYLFSVILLISYSAFSQISDRDEILEKSKALYQSGQYNYFTLRTKFKSSIANDTNISIVSFFRPRQIGYSYLIMSSGTWNCFLTDENAFIFDTSANTYQTDEPKESKNMGYYRDFMNTPFSDPDNFFQKYRKAEIAALPNVWIFKKDNNYLEISKENYSVKKFYSVKSTLWGVEYSSSEIIVSAYKQPEKKDKEYIDYIKSFSYQDPVANKKKEISGEDIGMEFNDFEVQTIQGNRYTKKSLRGRFVVFDLFYESCMPCIQSFPDWIQLRKTYDTSNLVILGIDAHPADTLNIQKFVERYGLNYDIVVGKDAIKFHQYIGNTGFPYTVLINPEGKLCFVIKYNDPKQFKKLKKYLADNLK